MSTTITVEGVAVADPPAARARREEKQKKLYGCAGFLLFWLVIFLSTCWGMIQPTQFGLMKSSISGVVDLDTVYGPGRKFYGWGNEFIVFPSRLTTLTIVVAARTGPGANDNSGGQPITLDVSFQYRFRKDRIPDIYRTFGLNWETSYQRFAAQAVTNAAQRFTPESFWQVRASVELAMKGDVAAALESEGFAVVENLQLVAVSFQSAFEQTITNIQLQEQLGVTRRFQLEVTAVEQEIAVLQSHTDAQVQTIAAEGARAAAVILNVASNDALVREQSAKASMYRQIRSHLNWTQPQFLDYIRYKALNQQPSQKQIKVAMSPVGSVPPA